VLSVVVILSGVWCKGMAAYLTWAEEAANVKPYLTEIRSVDLDSVGEMTVLRIESPEEILCESSVTGVLPVGRQNETRRITAQRLRDRGRERCQVR
jgi:hypothetical protein